jgi:hypothetical protein
MTVLRLVRLDEIVALDAAIVGVASLPLGYRATRRSVDDEWLVDADDD